MKSPIAVLLESTCVDIEDSLENVLERHRLDEDDDRSIFNHHWDYWLFSEADQFDDPEIKVRYPGISGEFLKNASYVKNLPLNYSTTGVVTYDGIWIDLQDFGWRMMSEPSSKNGRAKRLWGAALRGILEEYNNDICVNVVVHC